MTEHGPGEWNAYFQHDERGERTEVLANRLGIVDDDGLQLAERDHGARAALRIRTGASPVAQTFDLAHLRAIHEALFGEVYAWAGRVRTVGLAKGMTTFADPGEGIRRAAAQAQRVVHDTDWPSADDELFAVRLAEVFAWVNLAHPFREGNGRTTRLFLADVAALAGRRLEFARVGKAVWDQRSELTSPDLGSTTPVPDAMVPVMRHVAGGAAHRG